MSTIIVSLMPSHGGCVVTILGLRLGLVHAAETRKRQRHAFPPTGAIPSLCDVRIHCDYYRKAPPSRFRLMKTSRQQKMLHTQIPEPVPAAAVTMSDKQARVIAKIPRKIHSSSSSQFFSLFIIFNHRQLALVELLQPHDSTS